MPTVERCFDLPPFAKSVPLLQRSACPSVVTVRMYWPSGLKRAMLAVVTVCLFDCFFIAGQEVVGLGDVVLFRSIAFSELRRLKKRKKSLLALLVRFKQLCPLLPNPGPQHAGFYRSVRKFPIASNRPKPLPYMTSDSVCRWYRDSLRTG